MHVSHRTSTQIRLEGEIVDQLSTNPDHVNFEIVNTICQVYKTSSYGLMAESELNIRSFHIYRHMLSDEVEWAGLQVYVSFHAP